MIISSPWTIQIDADVARVECLYDVPDNKRSPHRAVVTWLCRPAFLPLALDNSHGMEEEGVAGLDNNHEVVGEVRRTTVITLRSLGLELVPQIDSSVKLYNHGEGPYSTRAFSWLKAPTSAFTFKTLLRHYAKRALTPLSLNMKLGP